MAQTSELNSSGSTSEIPDAWAPVLDLHCTLTVDVPLSGFTAGSLLHLGKSSVIASQWQTLADVPLRVNGTVIAWCAFEVVRNRLAVRITEFA
jgi:flagellar motor switch/type III secretory pathway protein FliN